ncbi:hypothetical protein C1646_769553 [Rhizophagus diaphanus]|nr:hypothetical protein C1646_769553 [Rhizophagus diaphanus] [Rhizophagus sp. MUCL 43196]
MHNSVSRMIRFFSVSVYKTCLARYGIVHFSVSQNGSIIKIFKEERGQILEISKKRINNLDNRSEDEVNLNIKLKEFNKLEQQIRIINKIVGIVTYIKNKAWKILIRERDTSISKNQFFFLERKYKSTGVKILKAVNIYNKIKEVIMIDVIKLVSGHESRFDEGMFRRSNAKGCFAK